MTYNEIYNQAMPVNKQREEKWNIWVAWAVRPLSVIGTMPFLNTHIKPTSITAFSILCSLVGFGFLGFSPSLAGKLLGWAFFFLWAVLDGVDGNLARCTHQTSDLGGLWDATGGYAAMVLMYFAAGIAAFFDTNSFTLAPGYVWIILGAGASICSIFPRLIMHKKASYAAQACQIADKTHFGLKQIIAMNLISASGFLQVILLTAILTHTLNLFVIIYALINFLIMGLSLYKLLKD